VGCDSGIKASIKLLFSRPIADSNFRHRNDDAASILLFITMPSYDYDEHACSLRELVELSAVMYT
jgi:hypothetical protein